MRGFKIESGSDKKTLKVRTFLYIKEWLDDYKSVVIAKVTLLDSIGNEINSFDLDVSFDGYSMECDYDSDDFVAPWFSFSILDD